MCYHEHFQGKRQTGHRQWVPATARLQIMVARLESHRPITIFGRMSALRLRLAFTSVATGEDCCAVAVESRPGNHANKSHNTNASKATRAKRPTTPLRRLLSLWRPPGRNASAPSAVLQQALHPTQRKIPETNYIRPTSAFLRTFAL